MYHFLLALLCVVTSSNSLAEWKIDFIAYEILEEKNPREISTSFAFVPSARDELINFELTQTSKILVYLATVKVFYASWENVEGEDCQVKDPSFYAKKRFEHSLFEFSLTNHPDDRFSSEYLTFPLVECEDINGKKVIYQQKSKRVIKKLN
jgi:hypothetical protein